MDGGSRKISTVQSNEYLFNFPYIPILVILLVSLIIIKVIINRKKTKRKNHYFYMYFQIHIKCLVQPVVDQLVQVSVRLLHSIRICTCQCHASCLRKIVKMCEYICIFLIFRQFLCHGLLEGGQILLCILRKVIPRVNITHFLKVLYD